MKTCSRQLGNALLVVVVVLMAGAAESPHWRQASPAYRWDFPRDHWSHPGYGTEWWYFTGHLAATERIAP